MVSWNSVRRSIVSIKHPAGSRRFDYSPVQYLWFPITGNELHGALGPENEITIDICSLHLGEVGRGFAKSFLKPMLNLLVGSVSMLGSWGRELALRQANSTKLLK